MSKAEELFHQIADNLPDAKKSKMFGATCVKAPNGKAAFMVWKDNLVFKLTGEAEKEALSLDGTGLFDPMGGRPMGGWVQVPVAYEDKWPELARQSLEYVKTLR